MQYESGVCAPLVLDSYEIHGWVYGYLLCGAAVSVCIGTVLGMLRLGVDVLVSV